ncbi:MAG: 5'/3'-nucleotidase SurE [Atribacterota bacterium]|jgi:5'-nucleotidase|nr:5'/3'-nucleotidase SurE [Atribacterota bacterium]MDD5638220.1 5'/3'-nucleotidase SurE [Atribacterota bacterium]
MRILVTNDDGIENKGLQELVKAIFDRHEVYVVAPDTRYTGYSGAVSFNRLISVIEYPLNLGERRSFKVSGTPADCVILALNKLIGPVDLVISGINDEPNLGDDIRLSATLGACRESSFTETSAIALSLDYGSGKRHYQTVTDFLAIFLNKWFTLKIPKEVYLNINFPNVPPAQIKGVLFVPAGRCRYKDRVKLVKSKPQIIYQIYGTKIEEEEKGADSWAVSNNYIAVTPLHRDQTDQKILSRLKRIKF